MSGSISPEDALPSHTDSNRVVESQSKVTLLIFVEIKVMALPFTICKYTLFNNNDVSYKINT